MDKQITATVSRLPTIAAEFWFLKLNDFDIVIILKKINNIIIIIILLREYKREILSCDKHKQIFPSFYIQ